MHARTHTSTHTLPYWIVFEESTLLLWWSIIHHLFFKMMWFKIPGPSTDNHQQLLEIGNSILQFVSRIRCCHTGWWHIFLMLSLSPSFIHSSKWLGIDLYVRLQITHDLLWSVGIYFSNMCEMNDKCQIFGAWVSTHALGWETEREWERENRNRTRGGDFKQHTDSN